MDVKSALKELADQIKSEVKRRMEGPVGVNVRAKKNTLKGSRLYESVETYVEGDDTIVFQIADYYTHVVGGWTRSHHGQGSLDDFIRNIERWIKRKGLVGYDATRIVWAIFKRAKDMYYGIFPRPFLGNGYENPDPSHVLPFLDEYFEWWADDIFDEITKEIDKKFT